MKCLILSLLGVSVIGCSNSIPNVQSLMSGLTPSSPKDATNFAQINAGSKKGPTDNTLFKGTLRIGQPLGQLKATSAGGYKLTGTVSLQK
ncbi:MAG: hypothetical protein IPM97_04805 [Bdellovibrionaceae bacterium]|nr:hypothetical protein [Pseudobdellovibrionaceae bacterium]